MRCGRLTFNYETFDSPDCHHLHGCLPFPLCISLNLNHILIESDSKVLVDILVRQDRSSWSIWYWWNRIYEKMQGIQVIFQHSFRECNSVADGLANLACQHRTNKSFFFIVMTCLVRLKLSFFWINLGSSTSESESLCILGLGILIVMSRQIEAPIALPLALPPYSLRVNLFDPEPFRLCCC